MLVKLPPNLYSPQGLAVSIMELKQYASWLDHETVKSQVNAPPASVQPPALEAATSELMAVSHQGQSVSSESLAELIATLTAIQAGAPQLHVTLAAMPAPGLKRQIVEWARAEIHDNALVSFEFNSSLLGGMVIRTRSHILDWSFRRQILADRDKFAGILRHV